MSETRLGRRPRRRPCRDRLCRNSGRALCSVRGRRNRGLDVGLAAGCQYREQPSGQRLAVLPHTGAISGGFPLIEPGRNDEPL